MHSSSQPFLEANASAGHHACVDSWARSAKWEQTQSIPFLSTVCGQSERDRVTVRTSRGPSGITPDRGGVCALCARAQGYNVHATTAACGWGARACKAARGSDARGALVSGDGCAAGCAVQEGGCRRAAGNVRSKGACSHCGRERRAAMCCAAGLRSNGLARRHEQRGCG